MTTLFQAPGLQITEDWIVTAYTRLPVAEVRSVWTTRPRATRWRRAIAAAVAVGLVLGGVAWAITSGWVARNSSSLPWIGLAVVFAAWVGALDPVTIWLEKRHHELWCTSNTAEVLLFTDNSVEVNKAMRAIQRARERQREARRS